MSDKGQNGFSSWICLLYCLLFCFQIVWQRDFDLTDTYLSVSPLTKGQARNVWRGTQTTTAHLLISFCLTFPYLLEFDLLRFLGSLSLYTCGISWPLMGGKKREVCILNLYQFKLAWNVFLRRQLKNKKRKTTTTAKKGKIVSRSSSKSNSNSRSKSNSNSNYCRCPTRGSRILVYSPSVFAMTQARHPFV